MVHLRNEQASKREYDAKCDYHNGNDRETAREMPALEKSDDGRQDKTQEDRQRDRDQHFARHKKKSGDQGDKENGRNGTAGCPRDLRSKCFQEGTIP